MKPVAFLIVVLAISILAGCASQRPAISSIQEQPAKPLPPPSISIMTQAPAQVTQAAPVPIPDDEALYHGAEKTYQAYRMSDKNAMRRGSSFIPFNCWDETIRALNPIYVYVHQYNIVVVQSREYLERGLYISNRISSYAAIIDSKPDRWGFTFTPHDSKRKPEGLRVHAFTRDLNHQTQ